MHFGKAVIDARGKLALVCKEAFVPCVYSSRLCYAFLAALDLVNMYFYTKAGRYSVVNASFNQAGWRTTLQQQNSREKN